MDIRTQKKLVTRAGIHVVANENVINFTTKSIA